MNAMTLHEAREMEFDAEDIEDTTVGSVCESIETNLGLAEGYFAQDAAGLATECLRSAWLEYVRFRDILHVYDSSGVAALGERLVRSLVERAGDSAAALALGADPESRPVWDSLRAA